MSDTPQRLKEWLTFHRLAGYSHVYVYDNTQIEEEMEHVDDDEKFPLKNVTNLFADFVTWIRWPGMYFCKN